MFSFRDKRTAVLGVGVVLAALGVAAVWFFGSEGGDVRLRAFVQDRPPVPVVFTSRSEPASFASAAPEGEEFTYPGHPLWQAREGRLRLLTPSGTVHELTWGKFLPDGSTLIDVMSPTVSPDGRRIIFAGRKAAPDPGHFRLFEISVNGQGLRQLTGGPDDPGCSAVPPMRFADAESKAALTEAQRRQIDYDDADPVYVPGNRIAFASTRHPDLGRQHNRRATNLWVMTDDGSQRFSITANRNNDRWPWLMRNGTLLFSLWSRNTERITADRRDIQPDDPKGKWATSATDAWIGPFVEPWGGGRLGGTIKPPEPVWRPRVLFNGRAVYMTSSLPPPGRDRTDAALLASLQVVQVPTGLIANAPSAAPPETPLPKQESGLRFPGPNTDGQGRPLSMATPSPCPEGAVLLSGALRSADAVAPRPGDFGIWIAEDNWNSATPAGAKDIGLRLLFDDPDLVDAEPVAVYPRLLDRAWVGSSPTAPEPGPFTLANGKLYTGPAAEVESGLLYPGMLPKSPGQRTDRGEGPIFDAPPAGSIAEIRVFASYRDRFDDPVRPRLTGDWELLLTVPVHAASGRFKTPMPTGIPTVLAGFDRDGRVVKWTTAPRDSADRQATFYAIAGDHYSGAFPGVNHLCVGCHPGHSGIEFHDLVERRR